MRKFVDLHLEPDFAQKEQTDELIRTASDLGFSLIGISLSPGALRDPAGSLQRICKKHGIKLASRIDLAPKSSKALLKSLRRVRRRFEVVAVHCYSKGLARQAAKDHRVDLLVFPSEDPRRRFFDVAEARLASQATAALEISIDLLLRWAGFSRARLLSCLRREVAIADRFHIPIVICSGAVDALSLRGPADLASLSTLFGMDTESAMDAVSAVPSDIVEKNRRKLGSSYIAGGIRMIRRGRNCDA